jgi:hypothetical protein
MKIILFTFLTFASSIFALNNAFAKSSIGFILGNPTGLSGKFQLDAKHSLATAIATNSGSNSGFQIHADYIKDAARSFKIEGEKLEFYYGLGLRFIQVNSGKNENKTAIGVRLPIGILYDITNPDIQLFGELSPSLNLTPSTDFSLAFGIGVRIRF